VGKDWHVLILDIPVTERGKTSVRRFLTRETALLLGFLFLGLVLLPVAIYLVGQAIFGDYGGGNYGHFFSDLSSRIRAGDASAWFLVLSPYLGWQTLRLIALGWRLAGRRPHPQRQ
jgi:hypothetical protein